MGIIIENKLKYNIMGITIENKSCLRIDDRVVCNEKFKVMIESTEKALSLDVKKYNEEKDNLKRNIKTGLDIAKKLSGYTGNIRVLDYTRYLQRTGKIPRQKHLTEKARNRLTYLGYSQIEKSKVDLLPQEMWEEQKIKNRLF